MKHKKTKLLSILLAIVMMVGLLPATAFAAPTLYDVWVGSTRVTGANRNDIGGVTGGKAEYDTSTKTLTFTGENMSIDSTIELDGRDRSIYAKDDLNIVVNGVLNVTKGNRPIHASKTLTFAGPGTLNASGGYETVLANKINVTGGILNVTVTGPASGSVNYQGICAYGDITISNAEVNAKGINSASRAIDSTTGNLIIEESTVTAFGDSSNGPIVLNSSDKKIKLGTGMALTKPTDGYIEGNEVYNQNGTVAKEVKFENIGTYSVTYNNGGGTGTLSPVNVTKDGTHKLLGADTFTAPGDNKEFDKWSVKIGSANAVDKQPNDTINVTADTTVTAVWKDKAVTPIYTITFNANGGSVMPGFGTTGTNGKLASLPIPTHTNTNMQFLGWFTAATGGTEVKANDTVFTGNDIIYAHWKDNTPPTTYTITVKGGKAYSDKECTTEITKASVGTKVYLKYNTPAANQYVTGYTVNSPDGVDIKWDDYTTPTPYYVIMPGGDLSVTVNTAARTEYVIDLTSGAKTFSAFDLVLTSFDEGTTIGVMDGTREIDLDEDGYNDIKEVVVDGIVTLTPFVTTKISGDWSRTIPTGIPTAANSRYSKVTYKFPVIKTYNVTVKGGKAYSDEDRTMEITKAKAGDTIYLEYNEPPADKYVTKITCNAGEFNEDDYKDGYTMPDKDVTFTVQTANRRTVTFDLRTGPCKTGEEDFNLPPYGSNIHILVPKVDIPHDLDGDGNYDILLRYSQTPWVIEKHPDTNLKGRYTINIEEPNTSISKYVYIFSGSSGGGGSSSGGGGVSSYAVEVAKSENGSVTASPTSAKAGDKVTLTPKPAEGYETDKITVTDKSGKEVAVTKNSDGTYSFTMPSSKVSVKSAFKEVTDIVPEEETPLLVVSINSMKYQLNGKTMTMDSAPFIDGNNRTMLPVRVIANALGISNDNIKWDSATKTASFTRADGKVVSCTVNSNVIKVGDEKVTIDTVPVIRNGRIYLPMRALFNAFDVPDENIIWDAAARTVTVTKKD